MAARPTTSAGGRPSTAQRPAVLPTFAHHHQAHPPDFAYDIDEDDELEDDDSDDEDVFAFLPPTTADIQQQHQHQAAHQQQQLQLPTPEESQPKPAVSDIASTLPTFPSPSFDPASPSPNPIHYPPPPLPVLSSLQPRSTPLPDSPHDTTSPSYRIKRSSGNINASSYTHSTYHHFQNQHQHQPTLPYAHSAALPHPPMSPPTPGFPQHTATTTASSREVHVSLPSTAEKDKDKDKDKTGDKDVEAGITHRKTRKKRTPRTQSSRYTHTATADSGTGYSLDSPSGGSSVRTFDDEFDVESREGSIKMEFDFDAIEEEDSPFPEVRASVSNIDDPDMPALTFRMWAIGMVLCMISSAFNVFFNFRSPAPNVVPLALLLVSYPCGKFLAFTLPIVTYRIPMPRWPRRWVPAAPPPLSKPPTFTSLVKDFRGTIRCWTYHTLNPLSLIPPLTFSLNPGPWNIKEHVLVYIMANVAVGSPYALNTIVVAEKYYGIVFGYWFSLVLVLATQLTGFGLAGLCRRFLVWPASMVWPQNLVACTLLNTLHAEEDGEDAAYEVGNEDDVVTSGEVQRRKKGKRRGRGGGIMRGVTRYRFFVWLSLGAFFWMFLPGFLFEALSVFSFVCWAAPNNVPLNQFFGVYSGLGMTVLTFDWSQISWIGSPLMFPWWAEVHIFFGFVLFYWIMTPLLYYTNQWNLAYFPLSANVPFDKYGHVYEVTRILKTDDTFDEEAYKNYSPLYLPATYAVTYIIAFALSTCVITHTLLYHGKSLLNGVRNMRVESDDIHAKLMRGYPEVPDWWYLCAFAVFFSLAVVAVEVWHTEVPVWALLLAVLLPSIYILPSGFIYAMTGQGITLNIIAQIIPGTLMPGNPLANMVFKAYSVQTLTEGTAFVQDLKLGHYVKVPPRATFLAQLISTTLAAFLQVGVKTWLFANVHDMCESTQPSQLVCPHNQVFFTASAIWGLIGPVRQYSSGSLYHPHLYAMVGGAVLPLPFWFWQRRYPNSWIKYVSTPVVLCGVWAIPPASGINYSAWFVVGFVFQYLIRKRNFAWWSKFNYVASAALDVGTVLSLITIFFTLQFPRNGSIKVNWWGNSVYKNTADYRRAPLRSIPPEGIADFRSP